MKMREKAEAAALQLVEANDQCPICFFSWDDPIKAGKLIIKCPKCGLRCHEPCLLKSGCICD